MGHQLKCLVLQAVWLGWLSGCQDALLVSAPMLLQVLYHVAYISIT